MKLVFTGDSITAAQYVTEAQTFATLVADALGVECVNTAVSGARVAGLLAHLQSRVLDHAPSSCVVMIGTNDLAWAHENDKALDELLVDFLPTMSAVIDGIRAANIHLIVLSPPATKIPRLCALQAGFTAALAALCAGKGVAFVDVFGRMMHGRMVSAADFAAWWLAEPLDLYHLAAVGHQRIASLVLATQLPQPSPTNTGTILDAVLPGTFGNLGGSTAKIQIKKAAITAPPHAVTRIRLTLKGHADEPFQVGALFLGHRAGVDQWDAASLVPVRVGGAVSFTVPQGGLLFTDWIPFAWDRVSDLIVSVYANGGAAADRLAADGAFAEAATHMKSGNEAGVANAAGFSSYPGYLSLVSKIETDGF